MQYLPPVLRGSKLVPSPPQIIISFPVKTAVCPDPGSRRIIGFRGDPCIRIRLVSAAWARIVVTVISAPDDHFVTGPDSGNIVSPGRSVGITRSRPRIRIGIVSSTTAEAAGVIPTPHDHFAASRHCRVGPTRAEGGFVTLVDDQASVRGSYLAPVLSRLLPAYPPHTIISLPVQIALWLYRAVGALTSTHNCPGVCSRIVSPTCIQVAAVMSAPNNHFAARPDCRVVISTGRRFVTLVVVRCVRTGVVSPTCVSPAKSTPNNHFVTDPHRGDVIFAGRGTLIMLVGVQLFVFGLYLPPVLN